MTEAPERSRQPAPPEAAAVAVSRPYGRALATATLRALDGVDVSMPPGTCSASSGPSGLRQVDAAGDGRRPARAERRARSRSAAPCGRATACASAPTCPSATCCCRGARRSTTPRSRSSSQGDAAAEARERARPLFERLRARRASSRPGPTSCRAGCASGSRSCARCWPASPCCCWTSRSPRSTRSRAPRCRSGSPACSPRDAHTVAARHPRRRGGALPLRPRAGDERRARARIVDALEVPQPARRRPRRRRHLARVRRAAPARAAGAGAGARREPRCARVLAPAARCSSLLLAAGSWPPAGTCSPTRSRSRTSCSPRRARSRERSGRTATLLAEDAWVTLQEVLLGFALALVAGVAVAVADPPLRRPRGAPSTRWWSPPRRSRSSSSPRSS